MKRKTPQIRKPKPPRTSGETVLPLNHPRGRTMADAKPKRK